MNSPVLPADAHAAPERGSSLEEQLSAMEQRITKFMKAELGAVESKLEAVESRLEAVESRLGSVESRLEAVEYGREEVKRRLRDVEIAESRRDSYERARPFVGVAPAYGGASFPLEPTGDTLIESSLEFPHPYSR